PGPGDGQGLAPADAVIGLSPRPHDGRAGGRGQEMRTRHRIPMIFSLSMMDVFCCTLGCVILLWLANQREARLRAQTLAEATDQLTRSRSDLYAADRERDALRRQLADTRSELARARDQAAATRKDLDAARATADELSRQLADARAEAADTAERL